MNGLDTIQQACQEILRLLMVRYITVAGVFFGMLTGMFGLLMHERFPGFGLAFAVVGLVLVLAGSLCLIHPPLGGLRLAANLLFVAAGCTIILWALWIPVSWMDAQAAMAIPLVLAFHGWLALRLRARVGDRIPETTPPDLRRMLGKVFRALVHGNPAKSPAYVRFVTSERPAGNWLHGWLSPEGYAVFLVLGSPVAFNENLLLIAMKIRRVCVYARDEMVLTPRAGAHWGWVNIHLALGPDMHANARATPASIENFQRWKGEGT